uniref:Uncharacterized protein n=1 Tax=Glossina pallidipes TaxID=7398 RepID=A0A1A9ZVC5_GLOPL
MESTRLFQLIGDGHTLENPMIRVPFENIKKRSAIRWMPTQEEQLMASPGILPLYFGVIIWWMKEILVILKASIILSTVQRNDKDVDDNNDGSYNNDKRNYLFVFVLNFVLAKRPINSELSILETKLATKSGQEN